MENLGDTQKLGIAEWIMLEPRDDYDAVMNGVAENMPPCADGGCPSRAKEGQ